MLSFKIKSCSIKNWKQFSRKVRRKGCNLLSHLDKFPNSILVTGCQRSGTTMLARIITQSEGMVKYWFGRDDELDAALILCGVEKMDKVGRFCFQTTYLNECYQEYFQHQENGHKLIWMLRDPYSVVFSLLHNWDRFALNELFEGCGRPHLEEREKVIYGRIGRWGISRAKRACLAYNGKVSQVHDLFEYFGSNSLKVADYEMLVMQPQIVLREIYSFIDLKFKIEYVESVHSKSLNKKRRLPKQIQKMVQEICEPVFLQAKKLI